jgi:hypothetical protein
MLAYQISPSKRLQLEGKWRDVGMVIVAETGKLKATRGDFIFPDGVQHRSGIGYTHSRTYI